MTMYCKTPRNYNQIRALEGTRNWGTVVAVRNNCHFWSPWEPNRGLLCRKQISSDSPTAWEAWLLRITRLVWMTGNNILVMPFQPQPNTADTPLPDMQDEIRWIRSLPLCSLDTNFTFMFSCSFSLVWTLCYERI